MKMDMKGFLTIALAFALFAPVSAQTTASFTGKWEGTFTLQRPDGTTDTDEILFNLTQKGKVLEGTGGPDAGRQWKIEKGAVNAGTATFEIQQPNGPLFKFTLSIVKGRLQGEMAGERAKARVDAAKAK